MVRRVHVTPECQRYPPAHHSRAARPRSPWHGDTLPPDPSASRVGPGRSGTGHVGVGSRRGARRVPSGHAGCLALSVGVFFIVLVRARAFQNTGAWPPRWSAQLAALPRPFLFVVLSLTTFHILHHGLWAGPHAGFPRGDARAGAAAAHDFGGVGAVSTRGGGTWHATCFQAHLG